MKKIVITAASLIVLVGAGVGYGVQANADEKSVVDSSPTTNHQEVQYDAEETHDFVEYDQLDKVVHMDDFYVDVVDDSKKKRILLISDKNGEPQYKSIYVKKKNRLKVIDFNGGLVFNEVLKDSTAETVTEDKIVETEEVEEVAEESLANKAVKHNTGLEGLEENATITSKVDVTNLKAEVVEDNNYKRIILLKDENNRPQYKSIYVKKKDRLKVIDFNGGLVHNGAIQ